MPNYTIYYQYRAGIDYPWHPPAKTFIENVSLVEAKESWRDLYRTERLERVYAHGQVRFKIEESADEPA
jgi:hypothetical protein